MYKKVLSILILACLAFTMVSCQVREIVTSDSVIKNHNAHKTRVLAVETSTGEWFYFKTSKPGSINDGTVTGYAKDSEGQWEEKTFPLSTLINLTIKRTSMNYTIAAVTVTFGFLYWIINFLTGFGSCC